MSVDDSMRRTIAEQHDEIGALKAENAKLREEIAKWERLAAGIDLPEYPVTQFEPKDLERENAKLRELVSGYADSFERSAAMNNGNGPYYSGEDWLSLANDMRFDLAEACGELGNEVDG